MRTIVKIKVLLVITLVTFSVACDDYIEVETPNNKIVNETVFNNDETAVSAMVGIYNQLSALAFSSGGTDSVTILAGLSGDALTTLRSNNLIFEEFEQHQITPDNLRNYNLWSSAYNVIYMSNALLEGLTNSSGVSEEVKLQLEGEARFVRAFTYFYLINLYGDVPLILNTNYQENSLAFRSSTSQVYQQILEDLEIASSILREDYINGDRTRVNLQAALGLLARVHLYLENWNEAESYSTAVIEQTSRYELLNDLNMVFLADSREAIWQLSPVARGNLFTNTNEGAYLIIHPFLSFLSNFKLENSFVESFREQDQRLSEWIAFHSGTQSYYPFKYKIRNSTAEVIEYSMVLRLAEQFLIRAESRAMQNNISGAVEDVDKIRERAGLGSITEEFLEPDKENLIAIIIEERKKEFFTEWGQRWLDLKRTGRAASVFAGQDSNWEDSDLFYPIPEEDRMKNPNLTQNDGY